MGDRAAARQAGRSRDFLQRGVTHPARAENLLGGVEQLLARGQRVLAGLSHHGRLRRLWRKVHSRMRACGMPPRCRFRLAPFDVHVERLLRPGAAQRGTVPERSGIDWMLGGESWSRHFRTYMHVCIMSQIKKTEIGRNAMSLSPDEISSAEPANGPANGTEPRPSTRAAQGRNAVGVAARWMPALAAVALLAACGRGEQHGGGFPPAAVTVQPVQATTVPVRVRVRRPDRGLEGSPGARARAGHPREARLHRGRPRGRRANALHHRSAPDAAQAQAAEADLSRAQAQSSQAKRNFDRVKPLAGSNALSQREYDEAVSAEENGAAAVKQAQAKLTEARLNFGYTTVTAPVAATPAARRSPKGPGDADAGQPADDHFQIDPMYVNFSVSEAEQLNWRGWWPAAS